MGANNVAITQYWRHLQLFSHIIKFGELFDISYI